MIDVIVARGPLVRRHGAIRRQPLASDVEAWLFNLDHAHHVPEKALKPAYSCFAGPLAFLAGGAQILTSFRRLHDQLIVITRMPLRRSFVSDSR